MQKPFKTTLSNGLRVLLLENHQAPVVSWNLWANVGSAYEKPNTNDEGLCHLIEHMLFKGTSRRPVGQIAYEVEAAGGDMNAYTSFDETVFYINMSNKQANLGLDILADAASDPTFDAEELAREKEVVVEEISRGEDNPSQMVSQDLFSECFKVHSYGRPIAGSRDTVRGVSREHLMQFFKRWYVGSNLIFIGVGDFKLDETLRKVEDYYGKIPAGIPPIPTLPVEPIQTSKRAITRAMEIGGRYLDIGLPIPGLTHEDTPAIDLLSHILGGAQSSRLEMVVKEKKQLMSTVASYAYTPRHPCLFIIGGVVKEKKIQETLWTIQEEMDRLCDKAPTTLELTRAREGIRSGRIYEKQTVEAMARKLGFFEGIAGDYNFEDDYFRRLADVTTADIQRVAQKYFLPERQTISLCHPKDDVWKAPQLISWLGARPKKSVSQKAKKTDEVAGIQKFKLKCGATLLVKENPNLPIVAVRSASIGGIRAETPKNNGITHLISQMMTKGTTHRNISDISETIETISGNIDGYMGRNLLGLYATFLSDKLNLGFDLYFDLLLHPTFDEKEILKEKGQTFSAIRSEDDSLAHLAIRKFLSALYGKHPYGLSVMGSVPSVKAITRKDLMQGYQKIINPKNIVFSVVGDVSAEEIKNRFEEKLALWKGGASLKHSLPKPIGPKKAVKIEIKKKKKQAHIVYGFLGTTIKNNDRYALEVLNSILSGQGGRLFLELRDKQSLAYTVSANSQEGIEDGYIFVYMGTDPVKLDTALQGIKTELAKISSELVSEEELSRAKRFIIGNHDLEMQKNSAVAAIIAFNEVYGIPREELYRYTEKIDKVTRQDVLRVAKKYLRPESSVLTVIAP